MIAEHGAIEVPEFSISESDTRTAIVSLLINTVSYQEATVRLMLKMFSRDQQDATALQDYFIKEKEISRQEVFKYIYETMAEVNLDAITGKQRQPGGPTKRGFLSRLFKRKG